MTDPIAEIIEGWKAGEDWVDCPFDLQVLETPCPSPTSLVLVSGIGLDSGSDVCPFEIKVFPCDSEGKRVPDPKLEAFKRASQKGGCSFVFRFPDGTEREMRYQSVEEGEDGSLTFTGLDFVNPDSEETMK